MDENMISRRDTLKTIGAAVVTAVAGIVGINAYGFGGGDVAQDTERMHTMGTLADNMAYMLKQFAAGSADKPSRERGVFTNFVRH